MIALLNSVVGSSTLARCSNIIVLQSGYSGVCAWEGASTILEGRETSIFENCLEGRSRTYGFDMSMVPLLKYNKYHH
jgi:hypothetical protein